MARRGVPPWMGPSSGTSQRSQRSICPARTRQFGMGGPLAIGGPEAIDLVGRRKIAVVNLEHENGPGRVHDLVIFPRMVVAQPGPVPVLRIQQARLEEPVVILPFLPLGKE